MKANETRNRDTTQDIFNHAKKELTSPVEPLPEHTTLYLVRRYMDDLEPHSYGVDDSYTLILATFDEEQAKHTKDLAEMEIHTAAIKERELLQEKLETFKKSWIRQHGEEGKDDLEAVCERFMLKNTTPLPYQKIDILEVMFGKSYTFGEEPILGGGTYIE